MSATPTFQFERRKYPRVMNQHPFVAGAVDPDLTRPSRTISPGKLLGLLAAVAFIVMACDGPVHKFLTTYNDNIVAILLGCFPAVLVVMFIGFRRMATFWRANLKVAEEVDLQRRTQLTATRAASRRTASDLHLPPLRPESDSRMAGNL